MPFPSLLCSLIDRSINSLLNLDPGAACRSKPLLGKAIRLQLQEFTHPLYFFFSPGRVDVLSNYEAEVDVSLSFSLHQLQSLTDNQQITALIKSDQLTIDGDIQLIQQFGALLLQLNIDWAEHLCGYTGDVLAHQLSRTGQSLLARVKTLHRGSREHISDYLTQELRLAPGRLEYAHFCDHLEHLQQQLQRLEKQVNQLEETP